MQKNRSQIRYILVQSIDILQRYESNSGDKGKFFFSIIDVQITTLPTKTNSS